MRDAKRKLIALNRAERLAERLRETERRDDLSPRLLDAHVTRLREQYRRLTGIEMEDRDMLQPLLEELAETGELAVDQLLSDFGFRLRNGCASDDDGTG